MDCKTVDRIHLHTVEKLLLKRGYTLVGQERESSQVFVSKVLDTSDHSYFVKITSSISKYGSEAKREIDTLTKISHSNIVKRVDSWEEEDYIFLLLENAGALDLFDYVSEHNKDGITDTQCAYIITALINVLEYLY